MSKTTCYCGRAADDPSPGCVYHKARRITPTKAAATSAAARAFSGVDKNLTHDKGVVIGYSDSPMYLIKREDGTQFWWRADLTEIKP